MDAIMNERDIVDGMTVARDVIRALIGKPEGGMSNHERFLKFLQRWEFDATEIEKGDGKDFKSQATRDLHLAWVEALAGIVAPEVEQAQLSENIRTLAIFALAEMPNPCNSDWQVAAKRVCRSVLAAKGKS